ncbi:hypothetical protein KGF56_003407 [Candida oxycetoniae]|uniref:TRAM domain-containing protein n=1 Tax=Candida oxycetoniae TaxID=497107 RepID=A0AAI9WX14_9ASCO|nr:uncharacterized protein KGF56_003407 [Candida oxycetoniae]KAI3403772.2 hypothetical protein KGF56_003407 [Candida oxycetoniae]
MLRRVCAVAACKYPRVAGLGLCFYSSTLQVPQRQQRLSNFLNTFKKTKRRKDVSDATHPSNITVLEIKQFLQEYAKESGSDILFEDICNQYDIIKAFLPAQRQEHVLSNIKVWRTTCNGDGIAIIPKSMYCFEYTDSESILDKYTIVLIPKTTTGDKVRVLLKMHHEFYAEGELIEVTNANSKHSKRNDELVLCKHFRECNGCQLQMLSYEEQLKFKQDVIKRAFSYFYPQLSMKSNFGTVVGSPLQYAYRTKLTPHFEVRDGKNTKLGFKHVNNRGKLDIEHCPIATVEINEKLSKARDKYLNEAPMGQLTLRQSLRVDHGTGEFIPIALEGQDKVVAERIEDFVYQFGSNCFFQNNSSILSLVLDLIRYHLKQLSKPVTNIVDTYCGVGFFGIALSQLHPEINVFGIDVSEWSIKYAQHNTKLNGLDPKRIQFILGDASKIFQNEDFEKAGIKGEDSVVIIDPSRKGSNEAFLKQLVQFNPAIIIYISCNVFTQARDLATFEKLQGENVKYVLENVVGFDFFPQTKHVESVAILKRV